MSPKKNAFFNFMVKRRKELEAEGLKFSGGWKDVSVHLSEEWEKMSLEDKQPFMPEKDTSSKTSAAQSDSATGGQHANEDGSGRYKSQRLPAFSTYDGRDWPPDKDAKYGSNSYFSPPDDNSLNTFGGRTATQTSIDRRIACFQSFLEYQVTKRLCEENIVDMPIILITCNAWCKNKGISIPAEIALLVFTIRSGVLDQYCTLVDPGAFPPGFGYEASVEADNLLLPLPPFDEGYQDYQAIVGKIMSFIAKYNNTSHKSGFIFCLRKEMPTVYGCIHWMLTQAGVTYDFELYPFEFLVMKLSRFAKTESIFRSYESKDPYSLPPEFDETITFAGRMAKLRKEIAATMASSTPADIYDADRDGLDSTVPSVSNQSIARTIDSNPVAEAHEFQTPRRKDDVLKGFTSEEAVLMYIERLKFGSFEFFGCLHHMFYSDAIYKCALNRLNRYTFQTLEMLLVSYDVMPVNGTNFIDAQNPNPEELEKRQKMLESWGLRFRRYPGYLTPIEREELRAAQVARLNALERDETQDAFDANDPSQIPVMFRPRKPIPEFMPVDPEYFNVQLPADVQLSSNSSKLSFARSKSMDSGKKCTGLKPNVLSVANDDDNDGWDYDENCYSNYS